MLLLNKEKIIQKHKLKLMQLIIYTSLNQNIPLWALLQIGLTNP